MSALVSRRLRPAAETTHFINKKISEWICRRCYLELLVDEDWQQAVDIAVQHRDFSHYTGMFRQGERLTPHLPAFIWLTFVD